jgi:hypothetical protein
LEDKPIKALDAGVNGEKVTLEIPRRQKSIADPMAMTNGNGDVGAPYTNSTDALNNKRKAAEPTETNGSVKKRPADEALEDDGPTAKRGKATHNRGPRPDELIVLDDAADGAIFIEDD